MNENKLVKKAMKGNKKAFEELLTLHSDRLYRTAYLYVGNREDALDVVQETAYKSLMAIHQLKQPEYFMTWLTKILIRCAYDTKKKRKREFPTDQVIELHSISINDREEHLDLAQAIGSLKENYRDAIILFYYQDLPLKDVATIMGIPENTVKTYLSRGKKHLRNLLGGMGYDEGKVISGRI